MTLKKINQKRSENLIWNIICLHQRWENLNKLHLETCLQHTQCDVNSVDWSPLNYIRIVRFKDKRINANVSSDLFFYLSNVSRTGEDKVIVEKKSKTCRTRNIFGQQTWIMSWLSDSLLVFWSYLYQFKLLLFCKLLWFSETNKYCKQTVINKTCVCQISENGLFLHIFKLPIFIDSV